MTTKKQTEKKKMTRHTKSQHSKSSTHNADADFMTNEEFEMIGTGNPERDQRESAELWE